MLLFAGYVRVAEVHVDVGGDLEVDICGYLLALVSLFFTPAISSLGVPDLLSIAHRNRISSTG